MSSFIKPGECAQCHWPKAACKCKSGGGGSDEENSGDEESLTETGNLRQGVRVPYKPELKKQADEISQLVFSRNAETLIHELKKLDFNGETYLARVELTLIKQLFDERLKELAEQEEMSVEGLKKQGYSAEIKNNSDGSQTLNIKAPKEFAQQFLKLLTDKNMIDKTPLSPLETQNSNEQQQQNSTSYRSPTPLSNPGATPRYTRDQKH